MQEVVCMRFPTVHRPPACTLTCTPRIVVTPPHPPHCTASSAGSRSIGEQPDSLSAHSVAASAVTKRGRAHAVHTEWHVPHSPPASKGRPPPATASDAIDSVPAARQRPQDTLHGRSVGRAEVWEWVGARRAASGVGDIGAG
eukprot:366479-Chlamydomonas_euryale.AAC.6